MSAFLDGLMIVLRRVGFNDILDILIVAYLLYKLLIFIRDSRAQLILKAILIIAGVYLLASVLQLQMVSYIVDMIVRNGAVALIVVFQPELRSVLERVGRSSISVRNIFNLDDDSAKRKETLNTISSVVESARVLQNQSMGALIVFECKVKLADIIASGVSMDVSPNIPIITNIFFDKAPLHDGAMIIRDNRICAASCYLPLTHRTDIDGNLGTRHRAAIGLSEVCDAVIVVVSEETGRLTVCHNGAFHSTFDITELSAELIRLLLPDDETVGSNSPTGFGAKLLHWFKKSAFGSLFFKDDSFADTEPTDETDSTTLECVSNAEADIAASDDALTEREEVSE